MNPRVVCICGSTRFRDHFTRARRDFTLAGLVVLSPSVFGHAGDTVTPEQKVNLDKLQLHMIDLADFIYVLNPGGYIGDSTRNEIRHARATGKNIIFFEPAIA